MSAIVLMDGGMGQELIARSRHPVHPLWSAFVLLQEPQIVREVHRDYIEAGARVITVNAYAATGPRLERDGLGGDFAALQEAACRLAHQARDEAAAEAVLVAGCLPPLVASYHPEAVPPQADALREYRRIVAAQAPHVDLFLCETMSLAREARAAAEAAAESGKPVWVAWTLADEGGTRLRSGETVEDAAAALDGLPVAAHLVNCCHPERVDAAMPTLVALPGPVGAYANAFQSVAQLRIGGTVAALAPRQDLGPARYADFAAGWVAGGARLVGGCCEVGPAHIAAVADRLTGAGHNIVGSLPC
ncbi:MAG: homocysteine S-methyltransferase family protein [Pseudomonadota bacterium]